MSLSTFKFAKLLGPALAFSAGLAASLTSFSSQAADGENTATVDIKSKLKADFRYRHEYISPGASGATSRNRDTIRLRASEDLGIDDNLHMIFGLASGENASPITTSATLGGGSGFSKMGIYLDKAYFDWAFAEQAIHLYGGKMKNPLYRPGGSELIWDSDLNPEGLDLGFDKNFDLFSINFQVPFFWVKEEGSNTKDRYMLGLQAKVKHKLTDDLGLNWGASYYNYLNMKGSAVLDFSGKANSYGNSATGGAYSSQFNLVDLFASLDMPLASQKSSVFFEFVVNAGASSDNKGWIAGVQWGDLKDNPFAVKYCYRWLQKDAVVGAFTDSDFRGGGTNGKGHKLSVDYGVTKATSLSLSYYLNTQNLTTEVNYNRLQADLNMSF